MSHLVRVMSCLSGQRAWWFFNGWAVASATATCLAPSSAEWAFSFTAVWTHTEIHRLVTHLLVHLNMAHWIGNALALLALVLLGTNKQLPGCAISLRQGAALLCAYALALLVSRNVAIWGASGFIHCLALFMCLSTVIRHQAATGQYVERVAWLASALIVTKVTAEALFAADQVSVAAHVSGAAAAVTVAALSWLSFKTPDIRIALRKTMT